MNLLFLLTGLALAQAPTTGQPLRLEQVRKEATARSLEVEAAVARAEAARGDVITSWSGHLPQVAGFATGSIGSGRTSTGFDRPTGTQVGIGLSGSWTVIDPSSWLAAAAARRTARGQEAMAAWTRVQARRTATQVFASVLAAQESVQALSQALEDAREGAESTEQLVRAGIRPAVEGARARADAAAVEARLRAAEGARASACAQLLGLVRQPPTAQCSVVPPQIDTTEPDRTDDEHPALVAAREALRSAESARSGAWLERAPTVDATGTAATWSSDGGDYVPGWSAGLTVELPLVTGGAIAGGIKADRALAEAAEAELAMQKRDLTVARVGAEARLAAARTGLAAQLAAHDAATAAFELTDERYRAGLDPLQSWLDARRDRDTAAVALAEARRELLSALAEVESARGIW